MRRRTLIAWLAWAGVGMGFGRAGAQERPYYHIDLGVNGGYSWYPDMVDGDTDPDDVRFEAGPVWGAQFTLWLTPRLGVRANGAYTTRPLQLGPYEELSAGESLDVTLWDLTGDVLLRMAPDAVRRTGMSPYLAFGFGIKNFSRDGDVVVNPAAPEDDQVTGVHFGTPTGASFHFEDGRTWAALAALGFEIRLVDNLGLRLEGGDRIWTAPIRSAAADASDPDGDVGKRVHQLYAQLGVHLLADLTEPQGAVTLLPPAAPEPAVRPESAEVPAPAEERVAVCVVDPATGSGLRTVSAVRSASGDTLVETPAGRRPLASTLPTITTVSTAEWFTRGEPVTLRLSAESTVEYTAWQAPRTIEPGALTYLGSVQGMPVYAASEAVTDDVLRYLRANPGVRASLEGVADPAVAREIANIQYLYVPVQRTGCHFQIVQRLEPVRK
jgi:hypothetical protein